MLYSLLVVFQSVTLEGWSVIMVYVQKSFNFLSLFFFIPLVFIGAFFLLNLTLVVIKSKFTEEHEASKARSKHRTYVLKKMSKEDIKKMKIAKNAYKKMKAINKKVQFKNKDVVMPDKFQKVYDRILRDNQRKHENGDVMVQSSQADGVQSRLQTAKDSVNGRPRVNILGFNTALKRDTPGNKFSGELNDGVEPETDVPKERNVLYLKQGRGKLRMEGMYGISRVRDKNEKNNIQSQSDLLEDIPLSIGDDGNTDDQEKNSNAELKDSDIMFPLNSSFTDSTKNANKKSTTVDKSKKGKDNEDKEGFSISNSSYEFDQESFKNSPDKKNGVERKNTNYFTGTSMPNGDNTEFKSRQVGSLNKNSTLRKPTNPELLDGRQRSVARPTKISSKIESDSKYRRTNSLIGSGTPIGKAIDFSIKNLIDKTRKKIHERKILQQFIEEHEHDEIAKSEGEGEENHSKENSKGKHKHTKSLSEIDSKELDDMEIENIEVTKKGTKIHIKRNTKLNDLIDTPIDDILKRLNKKEKEEQDKLRMVSHDDEEEKKLKTTLPGYNLKRHLELDEYLLEGKTEKPEEEDEVNEEGTKNLEKSKPSDTKIFDESKKSAEPETEESETNFYLEQFKTHYNSHVIATGTVSIVVSNKVRYDDDTVMNPCAISYGNIIEEREDSFEQDTVKVEDNTKTLRRNDTILPGALVRKGSNTGKSVISKAKTFKRMFMTKTTVKNRRARDEEEHSDENILKKIILDIPKTSQFYKITDRKEYEKEKEEDELLKEEDEGEEDMDEIDEDENENAEDLYLDRDIDFDLEIERARNTAARRKFDKTEWSGQDVKINYDPYYARIAAGQISSVMVFPYGIFGSVVKIRGWLRDFVNSAFFENLMTLAVAINTIVLALDHHGISKEDEATLTTMNFYFTIIFISEMGLKLIGLGPIAYLADKMNYLDGMVVLLSIFELAFLSGGGALSAFRAVRIMRTFRVLRVARLLKSMQSMQTIMDVIARAINSFFFLALLLLLFIFIYALLGMQTYGNQFNFDDGMPRGNFSTFNSAFITVFQVMTMENWQTVLYDCMRSDVNKLLTGLYLISWIFIGNFMLLNLFLAILLDSFAEDGEEEAEKNNKTTEELKQDAIEARNEFMNRKGEDLILDYSDGVMYNAKNSKNKGGGFVKQTKKKTKNDKLMDESFELEDVVSKKKKIENTEKKPEEEYHGVKCERSFYLFHKTNIFRRIFYIMTNHSLFENVVLVLIISSSIKLAYDTYLLDRPDNDTQKVVSSRLDLFFTFFFLFEALAKCISLGFVQDEGSYLRESWNKLDFFIVVASLFDLLFEGVNIPAIRVLRLLRTLRPLRFISHNSDMKLIVTALLESVGHIINVVVVVLMVWLMFAILAVNLFGGKFYYCTVDTYGIDNEEDCRLNNGKWGPYDANFDNVYNGMITLFIVSTLEGWPDIMYQAVDGKCVD